MKFGYTEIDYSPLKRKILEQAFASANFHMTEEQKQKLIEDKIERAQAQQKARENFLDWHTDR